MKTYHIHEIFGPTLQGEGPHQGQPCIFVRFAGCNAWDGRPETRASSACPYCDTDFSLRERLSAQAIVERVLALAPGQGWGLVLTGGEPLLQLDAALAEQLAEHAAWIDIESNGSRPAPPLPPQTTLVCSPKAIAGQPIRLQPDVWKILIPHQEAFLEQALKSGQPVFVQPVMPDAGMSDPAYAQALQRCLQLCYRHGLGLSVQLHKYLGLA